MGLMIKKKKGLGLVLASPCHIKFPPNLHLLVCDLYVSYVYSHTKHCNDGDGARGGMVRVL